MHFPVKHCTAAEAAALLRPVDRLAVPLGPGQPPGILEALGKRDDWRELTVFTGLLTGLFSVFTRPGVRLLSAFFGPAERALRAAGHDVSFVPGDFRRIALIAERMASRVVATAATPPDSKGWMSLALHAGATVDEIARCGKDPERLLIVETNPRLPRTLGIGPDHPHAVHVDAVDVLVETDQEPITLPDADASPIERAIAEHVRPYVRDGTTLQTGIGGIPSAVAKLLAEGPGGEYGIHSEMFTTGLMRLHKAGKVTNTHKGIYEGVSVTTFAMGSPELYEWLDGQEAVRFLPVELINTPSIIARNVNMLSINGALMLDLAGQLVADTIDGRQHSGIGGHEDFTSGASLESDDRSLICLPSTVIVEGQMRSRIVSVLPTGTIVTTPRHQLDVVVTEYGTAEVSGLTVRERARALAAIAHPDFREELFDAGKRLG
jgi:acyl-CoA hydrolase